MHLLQLKPKSVIEESHSAIQQGNLTKSLERRGGCRVSVFLNRVEVNFLCVDAVSPMDGPRGEVGKCSGINTANDCCAPPDSEKEIGHQWQNQEDQGRNRR